MLCQSLLPTAAFTAAEHDAALLADVSRAFGVDHQSMGMVHKRHHEAGMPDQPAHDHAVHCPLCLAHVLDLTLTSFSFPALVRPPFARPQYHVFDKIFFPVGSEIIPPRGPPGSD